MSTAAFAWLACGAWDEETAFIGLLMERRAYCFTYFSCGVYVKGQHAGRVKMNGGS